MLPYRWRYYTVIQWTHINIWWLGLTCGLRHELVGGENIPTKPTIILSKHQSAWETIALPRYFSPQCWVLKKELLKVPFFSWGLATLRPIAIDREFRCVGVWRLGVNLTFTAEGRAAVRGATEVQRRRSFAGGIGRRVDVISIDGEFRRL